MNCLFCLGGFNEVASATTEFHFLFLGNDIFLSGEFHFAKINDTIVAVNQQIYLSFINASIFISFSPPTVNIRQNTGYAERFLYLIYVLETYPFEGNLPIIIAYKSVLWCKVNNNLWKNLNIILQKWVEIWRFGGL